MATPFGEKKGLCKVIQLSKLGVITIYRNSDSLDSMADMTGVVQALIECFMTLVDKSLRVTRGSGYLDCRMLTTGPFVSVFQMGYI